MKFIVDNMLKGLTRWLRILGFDAVDSSDFCTENVDVSFTEGYFLTVSSAHYGDWIGLNKILIPFDSIPEQLNYLNQKLKIFSEIQFLSRCTICNEEIYPITKDAVVKLIPENVALNFEQYYQCPECKKIYWKGGHVKRMVDKLSKMGVPITFDQ